MKVLVILFGVLFSLAGSPPASAGTLVVIGDSLSDAYNMPREAGWVARLDARLGPEHQVIDAAISGDTSAGARSRIDDVLARHRPDALIVILGGNDGLRGLSPDALEANLDDILTRAGNFGARPALMQIRIPPNLGPIYVERFESVFPRLARQHGIELIPFFLEDLFDQPGMMMDDGIHPSEQAQPELANRIEPVARQLLSAP